MCVKGLRIIPTALFTSSVILRYTQPQQLLSYQLSWVCFSPCWHLNFPCRTILNWTEHWRFKGLQAILTALFSNYRSFTLNSYWATSQLPASASYLSEIDMRETSRKKYLMNVWQEIIVWWFFLKPSLSKHECTDMHAEVVVSSTDSININ